MYNCSVDYYWTFQKHLNCNYRVECEDGQDESEHCPFSSPACQGWVAAHNKCYKHVWSHMRVSGLRAASLCADLGSRLPSIRTTEEHKAFMKNIRMSVSTSTTFTLFVTALWARGGSKPFMYKIFLRWYPKTMLYIVAHLKLKMSGYLSQGFGSLNPRGVFVQQSESTEDFLCEKYVNTTDLSNRKVIYSPAVHNMSAATYKKTKIVCVSLGSYDT